MQSRAEAKDQLVGDSRLYDVLVGPNDLYADLGVGLLVDTLELGHATAIYSGAVQTDTARHSTSRPEQVQMAGGAMVEIVTLVLTLTGVGNTARGTTAVARQAVGGAAAEVTAPAAAKIVPTLGYGRGSHRLIDRFAEELRAAVRQADRILDSGGTGNTRWGEVHQRWKAEGKTRVLPMSRGNALQQIADRLLRGEPGGRAPNSVLRDLDAADIYVHFNKNSRQGIINPRTGNTVRPDYQFEFPNGDVGVVDLTTARQSSKIELYYGPADTSPFAFNVLYE